jgi:ethanolamine utilization protein EutJ
MYQDATVTYQLGNAVDPETAAASVPSEAGHADPNSTETLIRVFADQVRRGARAEQYEGPLRLGVDLGTANIVLSVADQNNRPVAGEWLHSTVVRDGIVVDWHGAVAAVTELKQILEQRLGTRFTEASVDIPPGISKGTIRVFTNVLQSAGLEPREVVDEPVAAARVLGLRDGCVIDVGHGTTGVSVLRDGRVIKSIDEPTGGHHMTLVLAGAFGLPYEQAEQLKQDPSRAPEVFGIVRPVIEKMATIAARAIDDPSFELTQVHLVGGASSIPGTVQAFEDVLGLPVIRPAEPLFVTPLGTAFATPVEAPTTPVEPVETRTRTTQVEQPQSGVSKPRSPSSKEARHE